LLGLIFVIASFDKLARPWDFGRAIYVYHLLDGILGYLISPVGIIMPAVELVTGILLIVNRLVRPASLLILAMNVIFIIVIISAIVRGLDIDCGCGLDVGIVAALAGTQAGPGAIVRDLIFLAMNLVVLFSPLSIPAKKT
jgi:putative oxidoreductase